MNYNVQQTVTCSIIICKILFKPLYILNINEIKNNNF